MLGYQLLAIVLGTMLGICFRKPAFKFGRHFIRNLKGTYPHA